MKLGSTLQVNRLRDAESRVYEQPVKLEPASLAFVLWQGVTTMVWGYFGVQFGEYLPIPLPLLPLWLAVRIGWPLLVLVFAARFHKHYV